MPEQYDPLLSLKELLTRCQNIKKLLHDDQSLFSANKLDLLDASNAKKLDLLHQVQELTNHIQAKQHSSSSSTDAKNLLAQLKTEIMECYQYIMTNSQVVFGNLQQLKDILDKLSAFKASAEGIYDGKGSIK